MRQIDVATPRRPGRPACRVGALDGTTQTLTAAGLAALPELAGPVPFATGTLRLPGHGHRWVPVHPVARQRGGEILAGVTNTLDRSPGHYVAELEIGLDYNGHHA